MPSLELLVTRFCQSEKGLIRGAEISSNAHKEARQVAFSDISILTANKVLSQMSSGLGLAHKIVVDEHAIRINLMGDLDS